MAQKCLIKCLKKTDCNVDFFKKQNIYSVQFAHKVNNCEICKFEHGVVYEYFKHYSTNYFVVYIIYDCQQVTIKLLNGDPVLYTVEDVVAELTTELNNDVEVQYKYSLST